ncbi:hypothetical protein QN277_002818 [Acacia crassicarpa]|uniref:Plant bHLH transcription factor ACT-like domain-containing protein n=1 Tax=Acacia crassicarpa TaxID=499986 RepID=A0AAE1TIB1_9FABA|nr:hypothetical protein QN277_002818 [Acacia crassicarpa]
MGAGATSTTNYFLVQKYKLTIENIKDAQNRFFLSNIRLPFAFWGNWLKTKCHVSPDSAKRGSKHTTSGEYDNLIAARREYQNLLRHVQEHKNVKVEKVAEGTFAMKVTCEKGGDKLVAILEAFEEKGLNVEQARVSCNEGFSMEAIVVAEDQAMDTRKVAETLLRAIGKQIGENN